MPVLPKQVVISVKAGTVGVAHMRDLRGVLARENAELGVLLTMREPTQPMRAEAASAGTYESAWGRHARLQILTVELLLSGRRIDMPPPRTNITYKRRSQVGPAAAEVVPSLFDEEVE